MTTNLNALAPTGTNGESAGHDLFVLSDEQILEIEPEAADAAPPTNVDVAQAFRPEALPPPSAPRASEGKNLIPEGMSYSAVPTDRPGEEPPKWLADTMADPQAGAEAREFWNGIVQARQEAAAYREVFAKPEEARAAAERSGQLEQIDRLYFGARGGKPEEVSAAREKLAETLLREDPAAFREMVFAGLRALEKAGAAPSVATARVAQAFRPEALPHPSAAGAGEGKSLTPGGVSYSTAEDARLAQYAAFEKSANEELEREVGGSIERTLEQAVPNNTRDAPLKRGAAQTSGASVRDRLAGAIRQEIETALRGDRQLGEQVAQVLAARNFNDAARAQVVRLIGERARQLVPGAAKRVLNDWTQTALAAHRARAGRSDSAASRADLAPAEAGRESSRVRPDAKHRDSAPSDSAQGRRNDGRRARSSAVDYRKLSDDQILEM
ncbi:MAG TPA: hypothetical protein VHE23_04130 [Candidatus Acidoferrales bacterium]|nr:hypothetical protein [Candidatus Acidoferrales bacterium]